MLDYRWKQYQRNDDDLLVHLCRIRQLDPNQIEPDYSTHLHNPNLLPDMDKARKLIVEAKKKRWQVTIFGDYDADGTPASAVLSHTLERLGIVHRVVLPTRTTGYGLNTEAVNQMAGQTELLITVDTGITAVKEIALAKELGIKVIVLDHHLPKKELPPADALVDPFLSYSQYPFPYLCGCALAYKLTVALAEDFPQEITANYCKWLLDIVAISTVADMMPIIGENRVIVHYGLKVLAKTRWPGLTELMQQAGINVGRLTGQTLGYAIGPRLNASGRLDDNRPAFDLLVSRNSQQARVIAAQIESANRQRQELVKEVLSQAEKELWKQNSSNDHLLVVIGDNWPAGVLGLVAGKLVAATNRPTIVMSIDKDRVGGSARSTEHYRLIDGLAANQKYLTRFGGHAAAAGVATTAKHLPDFISGIKKHAKDNLPKELLKKELLIDAALQGDDLSIETAGQISLLAPFGQQNPEPLFIIRDLALKNIRRIGSSSDHLKASGQLANQQIDVVGFGLAQLYFDNPLSEIDAVGTMEVNEWNGKRSLQVKIKDFRPTGAGVDEEISLPE